MSYILDALQKSEKANQRRKTTKLTVDYGLDIEKQRGPVRLYYLAALVLLLNVCLAAWLLAPWRGNESAKSSKQSSNSQPIKAAQENTKQQTSSPTRHDPAPASLQLSPSRTSAPPATTGQQAASSEAHSMTAPEQPQARPAPPPAPADGPPAQTANVEEAKPLPKPQKVGQAVEKQAAASRKPQRPAGSKSLLADLKNLTGSTTRTHPGKVLAYHDLPAKLRDSMPKISVSMLSYRSVPAERWININGAKLREGQEVSKGLKVERITPDGAIFEYQGHRFYKPVIGG